MLDYQDRHFAAESPGRSSRSYACSNSSTIILNYCCILTGLLCDPEQWRQLFCRWGVRGNVVAVGTPCLPGVCYNRARHYLGEKRLPTTSIDTSLRNLLRQVPSGVPRCVFVEAVGEALSVLELSPGGETSGRWVVLRWQGPPRIDEAIRLVLHELASVARAAWPDWFGFQHGTDLPTHNRLVAVAQPASLSPDCIGQAWNACQQGRLPLVAEHPPVVTLRHLTAAIAEGELAIVLAVDSDNRSDVHLDGICRMAQWLAANSPAHCSLLLSTALYGSPELASVDYEPMFWTLVEQPTADAPPRPEENKVRLWPLLGRPHPLSPGEQKLYQTLQVDATLAGLFQFNCPVTTEHGNTYIVDLLATAFKIVVEIDGYGHHANRVAFSIDRQRDYELHTSGYLVLRLPHDEIMQDLEACMEKIRRFLTFRQQHPIARG